MTQKPTSSLPYFSLFKFLLVGNSYVGKSNLLSRFAEGTFNPNTMGTIVDYKMKMILCDGYNLKLQIWDTGGNVTFRTIVSSY